MTQWCRQEKCLISWVCFTVFVELSCLVTGAHLNTCFFIFSRPRVAVLQATNLKTICRGQFSPSYINNIIMTFPTKYSAKVQGPERGRVCLRGTDCFLRLGAKRPVNGPTITRCPSLTYMKQYATLLNTYYHKLERTGHPVHSVIHKLEVSKYISLNHLFSYFQRPKARPAQQWPWSCEEYPLS
jgi:hypothetical protein